MVYLLDGLQQKGVENVLVCPPGSEIDAQARELGVKVFNVACAGDIDLSLTWWLKQIMNWEEPDVVRHELVARIVRAYDRYEKK